MPDIANAALSIKLLISIARVVIVIALAPLFNGLIVKFRARIEKRQGPSLLQSYYDLAKLFNKPEVIIPEHSSWIFNCFPYLILSCYITLILLCPIFTSISLFSYYADLIFIFGIFMLIAFFTVLCSIDAGTSFVGMGSSRESFMTALTEPNIMLIILALSVSFDTTNLFSIVRHESHGWEFLFHPSTVFIAIAFLIVLVVEAKRFPIDNPSTHLELTMIHEALLLEYSGKYLAMLELAAMIKMTLLTSLFFSLFFSIGLIDSPSLIGFILSFISWSIKMILFAFVLALFEKSTAKVRLFRIPELLNFALVITLIAIFAHYYIKL